MRKTENSEYKIRKYKAKQRRTASVFFVGGVTFVLFMIFILFRLTEWANFCQNIKVHKKSIFILETNAVFVV